MSGRTKRDPLPGVRAFFDGVCPACDQAIVRNTSRIVAKRGEWRHVECTAGWQE